MHQLKSPLVTCIQAVCAQTLLQCSRPSLCLISTVQKHADRVNLLVS